MSILIKELREIKKLFWEWRLYFLSHHPQCEQFKDDCYELRGRRLCIGCFTAYPIALFCIILYYLKIIDISYQYLILLGICTGSVQLLSLFLKIKKKRVKIIIKIFLGIGLGSFICGIFSLPIRLLYKVLLFIICFQLTGYLSFFRIKKIHSICKKCEYKEDWENCPGFAK